MKTPPVSDTLSLAELETGDPGAPARDSQRERRFLCPLPACAGIRRNAAHRSLSVNTGTGAYHCHRCGANGKLREWWEDRPALPRRERARHRLRVLCALPPPGAQEETRQGEWRTQLRDLRPLAGTPAVTDLESRGIPGDMARKAGARYAAEFYGQPAVVFPVRNEHGELVAAQGRRLTANATPKAITGGPVSEGVFMTPGALAADVVILCEAPIDALSLAAAGYPALALCGTAVRPWLALACAWKRVLLAFDADPAGDRAAVEWTRALRYGSQAERLRPQGAKDWNELLTRHGLGILRDQLAPVLGRESAKRVSDSPSLAPDPHKTSEFPVLRAENGTQRPACELLPPYAGLIDGARRGLLPPGPVRIHPGQTVTDPARFVLACASDVEACLLPDRRESACGYLWENLLADRLESLRLVDAWVDRETWAVSTGDAPLACISAHPLLP